MSDFFKLPRELRDEVYVLCLMADYEINAEPTTWEKADIDANPPTDKPSVALLRVSKPVYAEASIILYGRNHFRLPTLPDHKKPSIFKHHGPLFRHIVVSFALRDATEQESNILAKADSEIQYPDNGILITDNVRFRNQLVDSATFGALVEIWARKKKTRFPMVRTSPSKVFALPVTMATQQSCLIREKHKDLS